MKWFRPVHLFGRAKHLNRGPPSAPKILREEFVFLFSMKRYCPECHSRDVRRSVRWGFYETCVLPLILMRPYRCQKCDHRFFGLVFAGRVTGEPKRDKEKGPTNPSQDKLVKV